ncbi:MAG: FkbM family methyltransferase, partial [Gammaproteobacteria bacterium]|nr:FkbM family methyltransferase [Gammaproteobacteria bacterium]
SLHSILHECAVPRQFELLSIDVEGAEYKVLQSLDLLQYRPRLIVIEMHRFDISHPKENDIYSYLGEAGYRMHSYAGMNGYFVEKSDS